jgi:hypothetical protein
MAFLVALDGGGSTIGRREAAHALTRREVAHEPIRVLAVGVGAAARVAPVVPAARRAGSAVCVDETLDARGIPQVANGRRSATVGAHGARGATGVGRLADGLRAAAVGIRATADARLRGRIAEGRVAAAVRVGSARWLALVDAGKARLPSRAIGARPAALTLALNTNGAGLAGAIGVGGALKAPERRRAAERTPPGGARAPTGARARARAIARRGARDANEYRNRRNQPRSTDRHSSGRTYPIFGLHHVEGGALLGKL